MVVVGGGHNGLVAAAYLARAGRRVELFERRDVLGGCCVTEELIPGARFSSCAHIVSSLHGQIIEELALELHGLSLYAPDVMNFVMDEHGERLLIWPELDRTLAEIERHSRSDARNFVEFTGRLYRLASRLRPYLLEPPPRLSEVLGSLERDGLIEIYHEFVSLSIGDLVDRYFETSLLKGLFAFSALVSVHAGPYSPGTAYEFSHHSWGDYRGQFGRFGFASGGMGAIAEAIAASARSAGAALHTSAPVRRISVEHGRVRGVELMDGTRVRASVVVSNADPHATLLGLVGVDELPAAERSRVDAIDLRGSMALVHLLTDRLPRYLGTAEGEGPQHRGFTLLGTTLTEFERCWQAQQRGELAERYPLEVTIQSVTDPTLAPPGLHTVTIGAQQLPFHLSRGSWDSRRDEFTDRLLASFERFAPGVTSSVKGSVTITPLDLSREYGLTGGNIFHGAMTLPQLFASRPVSGWNGYATPIEGLFLCGAGTHPGGAVMGAAGHNAARQILGLDRDGRRASRPLPRAIDRLLASDRLSPLRYRAARRAASRRVVELIGRR